jgi:hypothetical protein
MTRSQKLSALCCLFLATALPAQIKVFTGGKTIIGSTNPPMYGATLQVAGPTFFTPITTGAGTPTSAAYIRSLGIWSTDSTADYTWYGDDYTGLFHPANGTIAMTVLRSEKFRFNSSGQILSGNASSSASTPEFSWKSDPNTGMYRPGADVLGFVANGSEKMRINSSGQVLNSNASSSASTPDFSWNSDANTGIYRPGADILGFVANGSEKMRINSSGQILNSNSSSSLSTPDFSWNSDPNTGIYRPAAEMIGLVTDGTERVRIGNNASNESTLISWCSHTADFGFANKFNVNRQGTKAIAVIYNGTEVFSARGDGYIWTSGSYNTSDRSLKENIQNLEGALSKVLQLQGVSYSYKIPKLNPDAMEGTVLPEGKAKTHMGLIAQDVEQVVPEVVETNDKGIKGVAYQELVGLLIEAVKEQNTKITQLESELAACCNASGRMGSNTMSPAVKKDAQDSKAANWLSQNKPNPFNKETVIEYNVVQEGKASILVFDMNGKLLKTIPVKIPGKGSVTISGSDLQAGMYYYSLVVNEEEVDTKKMILTE